MFINGLYRDEPPTEDPRLRFGVDGWRFCPRRIVVAATPKGIHLFFTHCAELPTAHADEVTKVDVRSGGSDIIFVAPLAYRMGAIVAEYKWLCISRSGIPMGVA